MSNLDDPRPHIVVNVAGCNIRGLLDSGASISILGCNSLNYLNKWGLNYKKLSSAVKTADGTRNKIIGYIDVSITYKIQSHSIRLFIVPTLQGQLYLGIDFWMAFNIAPHLVDSVEISTSEPTEKHQLPSVQQEEFERIMDEYPSFEKHGLGRTSLIEHQIDVGNCPPIKQRHYAVSPAIQDLIYKELDRMLEMEVIEESSSSWSSPVVLIRKPNKVRLCLDSRKVNAVTKKDAYPLPLINGILGRLNNTTIISSIDLKDAFWQIPLSKESRDKTAFTVPGRPLYHFRVMPFGLCNSPQTLCRLMDKVVPYHLHSKIFVYLDDLLVTSSTISEHLTLLKLVGDRLKLAGLSINIKKSKFFMKEVKYLGFVVGSGGLKTDPEKVEAIRNFPSPTSLKQTRRLLGMTGWYQRFINNYAEIVSPITNLLKKNSKFSWTPEAQLSFDKLKYLLTTAPVLINPDYSKQFFIRCDACKSGVGSVLYQLDDEGHERPIAFMSKKLNSAQSNYSTTELECLAAVLSVKKFRPYIEGYHFTLITDHSSLKWLMSQSDLNGRLARWSFKLQAYDFDIQHQRGSQNVVPDTLSRIYSETLTPQVGEIDINSVAFNEAEYVKFRETIRVAPQNYPAFQIASDRIYIKVGAKISSTISDTPLWKLWIPQTMTEGIIKQFHDAPLAAHGGIAKTINRIRHLYYWPGMRKQIYNYVSKCTVCKTPKSTNTILRPPLGQTVFAQRPWERMYIDLMGPYPRSRSGNTFLLVVLDQFTKFVLLKPLSASTSNKIISYLRNEVFLLFGVPDQILSDNGPQFVSHSFRQLLGEFNIRHCKTALYSPQANATERINRSIIAAIRAYIKLDHKTWDTHLAEVACALRTSIHQSTHHTPYFLLFGYTMITDGKSYQILRDVKALTEDVDQLTMPDRLSIIHSTITRSLAEAYEKYSRVYNLRTRPVNYQPGQEVYVRLHPLSNSSKKFCAKFSPKFVKAEIVKKIGNVMYKCKDKSGKLLGIIHAKDLKL